MRSGEDTTPVAGNPQEPPAAVLFALIYQYVYNKAIPTIRAERCFSRSFSLSGVYRDRTRFIMRAVKYGRGIDMASQLAVQRVLSRSGWSDKEVTLLKGKLGIAAKTGDTLRTVFEQVAEETGRKANSVRNY